MLHIAQMNLNIHKLEKTWNFGKEIFPLDDGGFTIGHKYGLDCHGKTDYDNFKYFTVSGSGCPLYYKEEGAESWELVKTKEQVNKILSSVPGVYYPEI